MILEGRYVSQKSKRCTKGLNSTVLDVDNLPRKELNLVTDNPRKFGRAVVTPHAYHSKKVGRNKAAVEANKQQIHIILAEDEAQLRQNSVSAELVSDGCGAAFIFLLWRPPSWTGTAFAAFSLMCFDMSYQRGPVMQTEE